MVITPRLRMRKPYLAASQMRNGWLQMCEGLGEEMKQQPAARVNGRQVKVSSQSINRVQVAAARRTKDIKMLDMYSRRSFTPPRSTRANTSRRVF